MLLINIMFECRLCGETQYTQYYCDDCSIIRRILLTYGREEIKEILERVCLRNKKQLTYKINNIKKEGEEAEKKSGG
jgi:primosomal protein N'